MPIEGALQWRAARPEGREFLHHACGVLPPPRPAALTYSRGTLAQWLGQGLPCGAPRPNQSHRSGRGSEVDKWLGVEGRVAAGGGDQGGLGSPTLDNLARGVA
jgi:hypothetical protein